MRPRGHFYRQSTELASHSCALRTGRSANTMVLGLLLAGALAAGAVGAPPGTGVPRLASTVNSSAPKDGRSLSDSFSLNLFFNVDSKPVRPLLPLVLLLRLCRAVGICLIFCARRLTTGCARGYARRTAKASLRQP
jgi:hypothetical protein